MKNNTTNLDQSFELLKQGKSCVIGENVCIALIKQNDFKEIVEMLNAPNVGKYLFYAPAPAEVFEAYFNPMIAEAEQAITKNEWPKNAGLIIRDEHDNFLGNAGITENPFLPGNFEIGFQLHESAWGKGIATMVANFLTNLAFRHLNAYKVGADCYGKNRGSIRVLEKAGFIREGCLKDYYGGEDDKVFYGITKKQFEKVHNPVGH